MFLKLQPTFLQAKLIGDPRQSIYRYYDCINLHPQETYLQITSGNFDIVFNGDYNVFLIDCNEIVLKDITNNVFVEEFTDKFGIRQIAFEIVNIGQEFNTNVFLKFVHTTGTNVYYSNPFQISSENLRYSVRLDYKSYNFYQGTDYTNAPFYQSIRLIGQFEGIVDETENATYIQSSGTVISQNPTLVFSSAYKFEHINDFTFLALSLALKSDLVFIDGKRSTDKAVLKKGERLGNSNLYDCDVNLYISEQTYLASFQIAPIFAIIENNPIGAIDGNVTFINAVFNKNVILGSGFLRVFTESGTLVLTLNQTQITATDVQIASNEAYTFDIGKYFITFDEPLFVSEIGETITNFDWKFEVLAPEYDYNDYSNDYLI